MRFIFTMLAALAISATAAAAQIELLNSKTDEPLELKYRKKQEITEAVSNFHDTGENAYSGDAAAIEEGGKLYQKRCKACHEADGTGKVGPNLVDDEWAYARTATTVGKFEIIYGGGKSSMRAFGRQMDQDDILKVMAFVDALASGDVAVEVKSASAGGQTDAIAPPVPFTEAYLTDEANVAPGGEIWAAQCRHCHGAKAYPGKAPKLKPAKYEPDFVYRRVTDGFRKMPAWKDEYTDDERMKIVAYIMSPSFSP